MAAKPRKNAAKKAAKKTTKRATKKTVRRTVAKTPTKRAYKRRVKPEVVAEPIPAAPPTEALQNASAADSIDSRVAAVLGMGVEAAPERVPVDLRQIGVLDLRDQSPSSKLTIAEYLSEQGYIWAGSLIPVQDEVVLVVEAECLKLNHRNRLVQVISWDEGQKSPAISRVQLQQVVTLALEPPKSFHPDVLEPVEGVRYIRVE